MISVNHDKGRGGLNVLVPGPTRATLPDVEVEDEDVCSRSEAAAAEVGVQGGSCVLDSLTDNRHVC